MTVLSRFASEEADRVQVRMPDRMRDELKLAAKSNSRSMNAEIIHRLKQVGPAEAATSPSHGSNILGKIAMNKAHDTSEPNRKATGESWFEVATAQEYTVGYIQILSAMAAAALISEGKAQLAAEGGGFIVPGKAFDQAIALLRAVELMAAHPMEAGR